MCGVFYILSSFITKRIDYRPRCMSNEHKKIKLANQPTKYRIRKIDFYVSLKFCHTTIKLRIV